MIATSFVDAMGLVLAKNLFSLFAFGLITVFNLRMCFALLKHGKRLDAEEKRKRDQANERDRALTAEIKAKDAGGGA